MGALRVGAGFGRIAQVGAVVALALTLAHCGRSPSGTSEAKYGVAASARLVEPGEPVPKGGGRYSVGKPYQVAGRTYVPEENRGYSATGIASWYGEDFHGRQTANGEIFDMQSIAAAHPTLPLPSYVRVTNLNNNRSLIVRVNDRGPYHQGRVLDVSVRAAKLLGFYDQGTTRVRVDYVGRAALSGSDDTKLAATLRNGNEPSAAPAVMVASNKPSLNAYFDPKPMMRSAAAEPAQPSEVPAVKRVRTTVEVATRAPVAPQGPTLASAQSVPAPAPPPRRTAAAEPPASFESRFGPASGSVAPGLRTDPVSAYAPSRSDGAVMTGRGLY